MIYPLHLSVIDSISSVTVAPHIYVKLCVLGKSFQPSLMSMSKAESNFKVLHCKGRLLALSANIRQCCKTQVVNTAAKVKQTSISEIIHVL